MTLTQASGLTPGQQLSAARKQQGKTLVQIADATRIFETRLEAIERDDYSAAGTAPAFVIGYVKTYAKQVGLDGKPLVTVVEAYFKQKRLSEEQNNPVVAPRKNVNWPPWVATAVALIIFIGLGQWFFAQQKEKMADDAIVVNNSAELAPSLSSGKALEQKVPLTQRDENLMSRDLVASVEESKEQEPIKAASSSVASSMTIAPDANSGSQNTPEDIVKSETPVAQSANAESVTLNMQAEASSSDVLKLVFTADCWVEVADASGRKQVAKLAKAGDEIQLLGKAPFDLKLGDAAAATGFVNGRALDLTASPGRRVLRIQVGP